MSAALTQTGYLGDTLFRYQLVRHKSRITEVQVGVAVPDNARFTLRREGETDRIAKAIGLAREWQTQDSTFDERVYIQSDDLRLHETLSLDTRLRSAAIALLQLPRVKALEMGQGTLHIAVGFDRERYGGNTDLQIAQRLAEQALPQLTLMRERLATLGALTWTAQRDPGLTRYRALLVASAVIGVAGLVTLAVKPGPELPYALVRTQIHHHAWMAALGGFIAAAALVLWLLGRRSRTHRAMAGILFLATPGIWCAASVHFELQNNRVAAAAKPVLSYVAASERVAGSSKRGPRYFLTFTVVPDERIPRRVRVTRDYYERHAQGQCVWLDVRPGGLGDPVLHGIRKADCTGETDEP